VRVEGANDARKLGATVGELRSRRKDVQVKLTKAVRHGDPLANGRARRIQRGEHRISERKQRAVHFGANLLICAVILTLVGTPRKAHGAQSATTATARNY